MERVIELLLLSQTNQDLIPEAGEHRGLKWFMRHPEKQSEDLDGKE